MNRILDRLAESDIGFRVEGFAILFFFLAACGAVALIVTVFMEDD